MPELEEGIMTQAKFIALARSVSAQKRAERMRRAFTEEQALSAAVEIVEAFTDIGLSVADYVDDAFEIHPLYANADGNTLH
jgi:hypothetical protein